MSASLHAKGVLFHVWSHAHLEVLGVGAWLFYLLHAEVGSWKYWPVIWALSRFRRFLRALAMGVCRTEGTCV